MKKCLLISSELTAVGIIQGSMGIREKYISCEGKCLHIVLDKVGEDKYRPFLINKKFREQGWRSGESTRLPPMWPRFESRTRPHMWVEFVVGSRLRSERFFS